MDFAFNEQQEMMQALARDFLGTEYPEKVLRSIIARDGEFPAELWQKIAGTNLAGLAIPEEYGGVGDFLDLAVVLEEMGKACFTGPFFATVVLGAAAINEVGKPAQKEEYLPAIAEGRLKATLAVADISGAHTADSIETKAVPRGDGFVISGTKRFVPDAETADVLICAARTNAKDKGGVITLFIIDKETPGVEIKLLKTMAGDKQADVILTDVIVPSEKVLGEVNDGWLCIEKVLEKARCARCAEMVGGARKVLDITLDYAKERNAFGHPIGAFQALQHRFADMLVAVEGARFVTYQAAWRINEGLPAGREVAIAASWVGRACRQVMNSAHQIHGAIGFTEDHILHLYTKKSLAGEFSFGDVRDILHRI